MNKNGQNWEVDSIKKIVEAEKKDALHLFRGMDFERRLQERINSGLEKTIALPFWLKKPIPILGLILVLVCVGVSVRIFLFPPALGETTLGGFEDFFSKSPALQRILADKESIKEGEAILGKKEFVDFEWTLKHVLFSLHKKNIPDENIPFLVYQVLRDIDPKKAEQLQIYEERPGQKESYLKKELECLKDQDCRLKLFSQILDKLKEV